MAEARVAVPPEAAGETLSRYLTAAGFFLPAACAGRGVCGKCRVWLESGVFFTLTGERIQGEALACRTVCSSCGGTVLVPENKGEGLSFSSFSALPGKEKGWGYALDIGTTTLAAALVNRETGECVKTASCLNPQCSWGADVISRICACREGKTALLADAIYREVRRLLEVLSPLAPEAPSVLFVTGNTTMLHLFAGVSAAGMGQVPFTPVFTGTKELSGAALGLPTERVVLLPSASAFIGSDVLCGVLVSGMTRGQKPVMLTDVGTNGETALFVPAQNRLLAASAAAGPALEGAGISSGVGGVPGAVCRVRACGEMLAFSTIGDQAPVGICGSGLIDLLSCLLDRGIIEDTGAMEEPFRLCGIHEGVAPGLCDTGLSLTPEDVRKVQLAKAALRACPDALLAEAGLAEMPQLLYAGGLGFFLNPKSAGRIGLLPKNAAVTAVGNTALAGCIRCLCDRAALAEAEALAARCETVALEKSPVFHERFIEYMLFPEKE